MNTYDREECIEAANQWASCQEKIARRTYLRGLPVLTEGSGERAHKYTRYCRDIINMMPAKTDLLKMLSAFFAYEIMRTEEKSLAAERLMIHFLIGGGLRRVLSSMYLGEEALQRALSKELARYTRQDCDNEHLKSFSKAIDFEYGHVDGFRDVLAHAKIAPRYYTVEAKSAKKNKGITVDVDYSFTVPCGVEKEVWKSHEQLIEHMVDEGGLILLTSMFTKKDLEYIKECNIDGGLIVVANGLTPAAVHCLPQPHVHVLDATQVHPNRRGGYMNDLEAVSGAPCTDSLRSVDLNSLKQALVKYNGDESTFRFQGDLTSAEEALLIRVKNIEKQADESSHEFERQKHMQRLVNLCGLSYVIHTPSRFDAPHMEREITNLFRTVNKSSHKNSGYVKYNSEKFDMKSPFFHPLQVGVSTYDLKVFIERIHSMVSCINKTEIAVKRFTGQS